MEIVLPHTFTDVTLEDIEKFGIQISKATHESSSQNQYLFKPLGSQDIEFESNETGSHAIIYVTHCCFWCLEANRQDQMTPQKAQEMAKKVGYTMHCIEHLQSPYGDSPPTKVIHFCVSFSLMKCIKAVKDQYPEKNDQGELTYRVHQLQHFKMNDSCVRLKHSTDAHDNNVDVALTNDEIIYAHQIDFWKQEYDIDLLRTLHISKQYPPSIEMTVQLSGPIQSRVLSINFEGCAVEHAPKFQIILPAVGGLQRISPIPASPSVTPSHDNGSTTSNIQHTEVDEELNDSHISTLVCKLKKCSSDWREIGTHLGFSSGELGSIGARAIQNSEGVEGSLRIMLERWMEWIPGDDRRSTQVATLGALKDALRKAGYGRTARSLSLTREQSSHNKRVHTSTERNRSADEPNPKRPRPK